MSKSLKTSTSSSTICGTGSSRICTGTSLDNLVNAVPLHPLLRLRVLDWTWPPPAGLFLAQLEELWVVRREGLPELGRVVQLAPLLPSPVLPLIHVGLVVVAAMANTTPPSVATSRADDRRDGCGRSDSQLSSTEEVKLETVHHHHHHHHQSRFSQVARTGELHRKTLGVAMDGERVGAAARRWGRRLRAWHRHVRTTVAMELETALHHSAQRVGCRGAGGKSSSSTRW